MEQKTQEKKQENELAEITAVNQEKTFLPLPLFVTYKQPEKRININLSGIFDSIPLPKRLKKFLYGEF